MAGWPCFFSSSDLYGTSNLGKPYIMLPTQWPLIIFLYRNIKVHTHLVFLKHNKLDDFAVTKGTKTFEICQSCKQFRTMTLQSKILPTLPMTKNNNSFLFFYIHHYKFHKIHKFTNSIIFLQNAVQNRRRLKINKYNTENINIGFVSVARHFQGHHCKCFHSPCAILGQPFE